MPILKDRIINYLQLHPEGADDDELAQALRISHRQAVNQVCRALAAVGAIARNHDLGRGKIMNRIGSGVETTARPTEVSEGSLSILSTVPVILPDAETARRFAYNGELGISEDKVKDALATSLRADGWDVEVRWGKDHGTDLTARRGSDILLIEVKGEGSSNPMRVNYFLGALGELVQRMESPSVRYGLAFPAHRQFIGLWNRLPEWPKTTLGLRCFFVRPSTENTFEIGMM